jgi:hypothetical protein
MQEVRGVLDVIDETDKPLSLSGGGGREDGVAGTPPWPSDHLALLADYALTSSSSTASHQ